MKTGHGYDLSRLRGKLLDEAEDEISRLRKANTESVKALRELLEVVDSLDGYQLTRNTEPYKAQAVFDCTVEQARRVLADMERK